MAEHMGPREEGRRQGELEPRKLEGKAEHTGCWEMAPRIHHMIHFLLNNRRPILNNENDARNATDGRNVNGVLEFVKGPAPSSRGLRSAFQTSHRPSKRLLHPVPLSASRQMRSPQRVRSFGATQKMPPKRIKHSEFYP